MRTLTDKTTALVAALLDDDKQATAEQLAAFTWSELRTLAITTAALRALIRQQFLARVATLTEEEE
jgi:hypothetical protein